MNGNARREEILRLLGQAEAPVQGAVLAEKLSVSRQIIVQDIALLRANGHDILSLNRGYVLEKTSSVSRVLKVRHTDEQVEDEMTVIVDLGGQIEDVFIYHKVYGVVRAEMKISSRAEIKRYLAEIAAGKSSYLMNVTSGYHYHTVSAASTLILDVIQEQLQKKGYLAELQDYEPVHFGEPE